MIRARTAILELLEEAADYRRFFKACCEMSAYRLRSQAWQFRDELAERGHAFLLAEIEDALLGLARTLLSDSPAAQWDTEWASELVSRALHCIKEHYVEGADPSGRDLWEDRMEEAAMAGDYAAFRAAVRGWLKTCLAAFDAVRSVA